MALQTAEEHNAEKRKISLKDTTKWQVNDKGQSEELLSYNLLTDIGVNMDQVSSVGGSFDILFNSKRHYELAFFSCFCFNQ